MLAVDTNLGARYLTADEPDQFERAAAVFEGGETYMCLTVLLETEWVLRSLYRRRGGCHGAAAMLYCLSDDRSADENGRQIEQGDPRQSAQGKARRQTWSPARPRGRLNASGDGRLECRHFYEIGSRPPVPAAGMFGPIAAKLGVAPGCRFHANNSGNSQDGGIALLRDGPVRRPRFGAHPPSQGEHA